MLSLTSLTHRTKYFGTSLPLAINSVVIFPFPFIICMFCLYVKQNWQQQAVATFSYAEIQPF